jgi:hypothetical protein
MSDDLLERATRALHDEGTAPAEELAETRARVLAGASGAQVRRVRALRWVLPLAAVFLAGSAFAATNGGIERAVRHLQTWFADAPTASAPRPKPQKPKPARATPAPVLADEAAAPAAPALEPPQVAASAPVESAKPPRRKRAQERAPSAPTVELPAPQAVAELAPPTPPTPPANPDLALYREAHQLHFKAQAHARALAVWDAYLARFPAGMFAVEARYNRAICLVRLGRRREAIDALEPFAAGRVGGGYRREEAHELLDALRGTP